MEDGKKYGYVVDKGKYSCVMNERKRFRCGRRKK